MTPDVARMLAAAEAAAPVDAVGVVALELGKRLGAQQVAFLIADHSATTLSELAHAAPTSDRGGREPARTIPLNGTVYEQVVRDQRVRISEEDGASTVFVPVTNRGNVMGVLELVVFEPPDSDALELVAVAGHLLGYIVIANGRFTDFFEWGQRSAPTSVAGEIQRRLLPESLACEAGQFTIAGALEPTGDVGGDTFDYSLERDTLHVSLTDAMGHGIEAAQLATLLVGSLRNSRRAHEGLAEQAGKANTALVDHSDSDQYASGQLLRVDLATGTAHIVNAGHPSPLRLRDGEVEPVELDADLPFGMMDQSNYRTQRLSLEPGDRLILLTDGLFENDPAGVEVTDLIAVTASLHPREVVQSLTRATVPTTDDRPHDDATAVCLDWYGPGDWDRHATTGADPDLASLA